MKFLIKLFSRTIAKERMRNGICILILLLSYSHIAYGGDYIIGGGDSLKISVWGNPELSLETIVRPDGKISLPAVGDMKASGFTPVQLKDALEKELEKMVKAPVVTVIVTKISNYRVFIFGKGSTPGVYPLTKETTLLELLAQLGPLSNADLQNSYLVRNKKKIKIGFYDLFEKGDFSKDIILEPDDMLFIPDDYKNRISIVGAVQKPESIPFREELTILDVIITAGGFTEFAKDNDVKIMRNDNGSKIELTVRAKDLMKKGEMEENISMKPGDVVIVKEAIF